MQYPDVVQVEAEAVQAPDNGHIQNFTFKVLGGAPQHTALSMSTEEPCVLEEQALQLHVNFRPGSQSDRH